MRSYQIMQTVADRQRGVIRVERVGRGASRHWTTDEFEVALADVLHSHGVHVVRQFLLTDGTTRIFIIDVDGDGFALFEESRRTRIGGEHPVPIESTTTSTRPRPAWRWELPGGVVVGPRNGPDASPQGDPGGDTGGERDGVSAAPTHDLVADGPCSQPRDQEA